MNEVSYLLALLVIFVLSASGSPSTSSKITVQGAIIRNGKKVIRGVEGNDLNIVCNIVSGIPTIKFGMNINGFKFKRVGNGSLTYHFKPSRKDNRKSFVCSAYSPLLDNPLSSRVLLDIQYAPIVNIIKKVTRKKLELICSPKGNPDSYTFDNWEHLSEFKQHIRNVKGTPENKLTFLKYNNNNSFHENDGIYKCKTSNGINGTNGRLYQKGSVLLNNKASPIFVNGNEPIQYGRYGEKINLKVFLYNKYGTIQTTISKRNEILNIHGRQEKVLTQDIFHDINVTVSGIKITFLLTLGRIDDFTDYTITACNNKGCNNFTVNLTSNCRPEPPSYVEVITYARYLEVIWDPGFDRGYQQTFYVEYQKEAENTWKRSGPVVDKRHVKMSIILNDLNPKTRYHVRMLSKNAFGKSNTTAVSSVMTVAELPKSPTNVSVIPYDRHLEVSWCPGYNTGDPQMFFIEYQQVASEKWTRSGPIIDNMQTRMSNLLYNMTPNTRYLVRIFSRNEIGESKKTPVIDAMTLANNKSVKQVLSSQGIVILVLVIIVTVIGSGIGLCIRYIRQEKKNRVITPTHILTTETSSDEIAHYTEIIGDDYRRTTCQENDIPIISMVNIVGVGNGDTVPQFSEHAPASSDNNTNTLENYDDGYEKPYTTLVVQNRADDVNGIIPPTHVLTTEASNIESALYTEIVEDDYRQTIQQENDNPIISMVNTVGVGNGDTVSLFSEHASASSDDNTNTLENYDDGYEKPYTTLVVQNRADDENGIITPTHVLTTEECIIESGHYTEINEDDYRQTILQENENSIISTVNVIGVNNTDTTAQSSEQSSGSFDNNMDTSEGYDDGYKQPYTTLVVQQRADDEHVYLNTNTFYENATPFEKACPDRPCGENKNPSTIDNDVDKNDKDFNRSHIDPPKYKATYINLMLK